MPRRDTRAFLHDAQAAAEAIRGFIAHRSLDEYRSDLMLRSAVERQFEIIGEALRRAMKLDPSLTDRLAAARGPIDFRNVIAHGYDKLADTTVWDIARHELPALAADLSTELSRLSSE